MFLAPANNMKQSTPSIRNSFRSNTCTVSMRPTNVVFFTDAQTRAMIVPMIVVPIRSAIS